MTVNDYILQKFQTFGVNLSEADLFDICLNANMGHRTKRFFQWSGKMGERF